MKHLLKYSLMVLVAAGLLVFATGYTRDISGDLRRDAATGIQACLVALEALITDSAASVTDLAAIETAVLHNTRGVGLTAVTVDTWTALSGIGTHRYLQIVCINGTDAATATLNIWGSDDGGTTFYPMVRADTLAKAKDVAIDVGTDFNPTEGAGVTNSDTIIVAVGPATHIYIDAEGGATAGFTYEVGGL